MNELNKTRVIEHYDDARVESFRRLMEIGEWLQHIWKYAAIFTVYVPTLSIR